MIRQAIICTVWGRSVEPVLSYLRENPSTILVFESDYSAELEKVVNAYGGEVLVIDSLLSAAEFNQIQEEAIQRATRVINEMQGASWDGFCKTHSVSATLLRDNVVKQIKNGLLFLMLKLAAVEKVKEIFDVRMMIVNEEYTLVYKGLCLWAKNNAIPVLHLAHGAGLFRPVTVHLENNADYYAVLTQRSLLSPLKVGVDSHKIQVTGCPWWDVYNRLKSEKSTQRTYLCQKYNIPESHFIISYFPTWACRLSATTEHGLNEVLQERVIRVIGDMRKNGFKVSLIVKDREANLVDGQRLFNEMIARAGLDDDQIIYTFSDLQSFVAASDVTISVDSNIVLESAVAQTAAINITTESGWLLGPGFAGDDGVIETEIEGLQQTLEGIIQNPDSLESYRQKLANNQLFIYANNDGRSDERVKNLMREIHMSHDQPVDPADQNQLWRTLGKDVEVDNLYHQTPRSELFPIFKHVPQVVIEVGCAAGATGAAIKQLYPGVKVYGVELNANAAEIAKTRIDGVINKNIESCDISELGIEFGSVDTFIAADVLEHLYNPWAVLDKIKPLLTEDAQVIVSIPNSQNAWLMTEMASGRWSYDREGLLDITHIRFFTKDEIAKMFDDTGYDTVKWSMTIDGRVPEMPLQDGEVQSIDLGKLVLKDISKEEWMIYRALQFLVCATPREGQVTYPLKHQKQRKDKAKIVLYTFEQPSWACAELRVNSPLKLLGDEVEIIWGVTFSGDQVSFDDSLLSVADAFIFHRFFPCEATWPFIEKVLALGKPVIYETDDLLCSMPDLNPSASQSEKIKNYIFDLLGRVDNVIVSTDKLAENYAPYANNIYVVPNRINVDRWGESKRVNPAQRPLVIGYLGTPTHLADLAIIEDALFRLSEKYGNQISFRFMGCITDKLKSLPGMHFTNVKASYEEYVDIIKRLNIDIALAPLENNQFNKAKSNIKWMEYSYCGIPGVYINLEPYVDSVINYDTGVLATADSESWFTAIDYLITHPQERERIGNNARNAVASRYTIAHDQSNIANVYRGLLLEENKPTSVDNASVTYAGCHINQVVAQAYLHDSPDTEDELLSMGIEPSIHLLILGGEGQESLIESSLASLLTQDYKSWGLTVISSAACDSPVYDQMDNLEWVIVEQDWQATVLRSISETRADWVGFIRPGDQFDTQMLSMAVGCFNQHLDAQMIYLGMDYIDNNGQIKYFNSESSQHTEIPELSHLIRGTVIDVLPVLDECTPIDHCHIANLLVARDGMSCIRAVKQKVYHRLDGSPAAKDKKHKLEKKTVPYQVKHGSNDQVGGIETAAFAVNTGNNESVGDNNHLNEARQYELWCQQHAMSEIDAQILAERMYHGWSYQPVFNLVCILKGEQFAQLADTIDCLAAQFYKRWKLSIISDAACDSDELNNIENIAWYQYKDNKTDVLNKVIVDTASDWVMLLQAGTRLEANTLMVFADYANAHPQWACIYSDHDSYESGEDRVKPCFKPDINFDYLLSMNYIGNAVAFSKQELLKLGGYRAYDCGENYELLLRFHQNIGAENIGHITDVLFHLRDNEPRLDENEHKAILTDHFREQDAEVDIQQGYAADTLRIIYKHEKQAKVSIIIPTKDMLEYVRPCVESLLEKTSYSDYEILLIDNGSEDRDVLEFYTKICSEYPGKISVKEYPFEFNYSAMINLGVEHARGNYVLQLNNDTEVIQEEWLDRMMNHAQRPDVGIVGSKLVFPGSGNIQHAGVVLGMDDIAGHPFINALDLKAPGYMNRAQVDQEYSAVTGACLLARKDIYRQVGGMDNEDLKVSYNDIDLCLKVRQAGYKVIWTPYSVLLHHGSVSQIETQSNVERKLRRTVGFRHEQDTMVHRWREVIINDPNYNKNLSLTNTLPQPDYSCVINWYGASKERPRIFGMPVSGGSGEYRVKAPLRTMARQGIAQIDYAYSPNHRTQRVLTVAELMRIEADSILVQNFLGDSSLDALERYKKYTDVFITQALDDLITDLPEGNEYRQNIPLNARTRLRKALKSCDRLIVSTQPLHDLCNNMIDDIVVIPNYLESSIWSNLESHRHYGPKPRVGWAGAQQHSDDLAFIEDVVRETANEIDWVFFGMCPSSIRPYVSEVHAFEHDFEKYALKLATLNLDLAIAPLHQHPFNEAKSNLRLLEYGAMGWPVICTDILPYQNAPVKRINNDARSWITAIRERIYDLDATYKEGDELKKWVLSHHMLDQHVDIWTESLLPVEMKSVYQDLCQQGKKRAK